MYEGPRIRPTIPEEVRDALESLHLVRGQFGEIDSLSELGRDVPADDARVDPAPLCSGVEWGMMMYRIHWSSQSRSWNLAGGGGLAACRGLSPASIGHIPRSGAAAE